MYLPEHIINRLESSRIFPRIRFRDSPVIVYTKESPYEAYRFGMGNESMLVVYDSQEDSFPFIAVGADTQSIADVHIGDDTIFFVRNRNAQLMPKEIKPTRYIAPSGWQWQWCDHIRCEYRREKHIRMVYVENSHLIAYQNGEKLIHLNGNQSGREIWINGEKFTL